MSKYTNMIEHFNDDIKRYYHLMKDEYLTPYTERFKQTSPHAPTTQQGVGHEVASLVVDQKNRIDRITNTFKREDFYDYE